MQSQQFNSNQNQSKPQQFFFQQQKPAQPAYNPEAAYYALPKAFILRVMQNLSPSTTKVFLALTYHTDPYNIIKYPEKITYKNIMAITGIKKLQTIQKAFSELVAQNIIGGFTPGSGSENTKFYFTFDIEHYRNNNESCFKIEELESFYNAVGSNRSSQIVSVQPEIIESVKETKSESIPDETPPVIDRVISNSKSTEMEEIEEIIEETEATPGQYHAAGVSSVENIKGASSAGVTEERQGIAVPGGFAPPPCQKTAGGSTEKGYTLNTIFSKLINSHSYTREDSKNFKNNGQKTELNIELIQLARLSNEFLRSFNEFCVCDSSIYREKTFYWTMFHASKHNLSLAEVTESLNIAVNKGKEGKMNYLIGIMKNKSGDKSAGIYAAGKNIVFQISEFIKTRIGINMQYFQSFEILEKQNKLLFAVNNDSDKVYIKDYISLIISDVNKKFGTSLLADIA